MRTIRRVGATPSLLVALVALLTVGFGGHALAAGGIAPPTITSAPANPTTQTSATFTFEHQRSVRFDCALDGSSFRVCGHGTSGAKSYANLARSMHTFRVRATRSPGRSATRSYHWKVINQIPPSTDFVVTGNACCLFPGVWRSIDVAVTNRSTRTIRVNQLSVVVASSPAGCPASSNIQIEQSPISESHLLTVPAHSTVHVESVDRPRIQLKNLAVNQDGCQGTSFGLRYSGRASS